MADPGAPTLILSVQLQPFAQTLTVHVDSGFESLPRTLSPVGWPPALVSTMGARKSHSLPPDPVFE